MDLRIAPLLSAVVSAVLTLAPVTSLANATRTYEVDIRVFCHPSDGKGLCAAGSWPGFASVASMRADYEARFREINEIYRPAKISFRIAQLVYAEDTYFSEIKGPGEDAPTTSSDFARVSQLRTFASSASNRDRITLFALPDISICWSAIPPEPRCKGGIHDLEICTGNPDYCAGAPCENDSLGHYGVFCVPGAAAGSWGANTMAHELGHHFCLSHVQSDRDYGQLPDGCNATPNYDADGLSDTPQDPGPAEILFDPNANPCSSPLGPAYGKDLCVAYGTDGPPWPHTNVNECHDWCEWVRIPGLVDAGSPTQNLCVGACYRKPPGGSIETGHYSPRYSLVMSYYEKQCAGPYVIHGDRVEAFSPQQLAKIDQCIQTIPERIDLLNVCADSGGDSDNDGVCDADDPCPFLVDYGPDVDPDGDGIPSGCDLCPDDPTPATVDTDGDGVGDLCDPNDDNDACDDASDQHPLQAEVQVGWIGYGECGVPDAPALGSESADPDLDSLPNCADPDDDNDGIPDDEDPCPITPGTEGCTTPAVGCPPVAAPWQTACAGPACGIDFDLVLVSLIDPADTIVFDTFQVVGDSLVVPPLPGSTLSETLPALSGARFPNLACGRTPCLELQIQPQGGGRPIAIVTSYQPGDVSTTETGGRMVAITPKADASLVLTPRWGAGIVDAEELADADGDGVPDASDDCIRMPNARQRDGDHDGFGDVCDLDRDQDGHVGWDEYQLVASCRGMDLALPPRSAFEYDGTEREPPAPTEELAHWSDCAGADLNEDDLVDDDDLALAERMVGFPPGPSGTRAVLPRDRLCGDGNGDGTVTALDALVVLKTAVGGFACEPCVCDVDASGVVTATDALATLRLSVAIPAELGCRGCG